ncbi:MAG: universal stress protein [Halanaeroarchaeum sp.]
MSLDTLLLAIGSDDEERTDALIDTVIELAEAADASVIVGHVFTPEDFREIRSDLNMTGSDATADEVARHHVAAREISSSLAEAGIDHEIRGREGEGERGEEIVELAKDVAADRVFVGGRKRSPTGKALFGSTAQAVMLNAPCPVTFVRDQ